MEKTELILSKLCSAQGRRDEGPNIELAMEIVETEDTEAIDILVHQLTAKKAIRKDCIKTLYEVGNLMSGLIAQHFPVFLQLLISNDNRVQWGAMTAIECIARENPKLVYPHLSKVLEASEQGSVITRDNAVKILAHIGQLKEYSEPVFQMLHEVLLTAPVNQFPSYAEIAAKVVNEENKGKFIQTIEGRMDEMNTSAKRKRLIRVIKKL